MRLGIIGVGGWGKNYLRVLQELGTLQAFCDIDPQRVRTYQERYHTKGYNSVGEMLDSEALDAVTICTPPSSHFEVAKEAILRSKHILVEKPLTTSSIEARELVELAERMNVILTVGFIERFNPAVSGAKRILDSGQLGKPILLEFHRENRMTSVVHNVGIVPDASIHDIDTACWLFGSEPSMVFARTSSVGGEQENVATMILGFQGERNAFISTNWVTPKRVRKLSIVCTEGIIDLDFLSQQVEIADSNGSRVLGHDWEEPLMLEMKSFAEAVERGRPLVVTGKDGVNATRIVEAVLISSRTGSPIYLDL